MEDGKGHRGVNRDSEETGVGVARGPGGVQGGPGGARGGPGGPGGRPGGGGGGLKKVRHSLINWQGGGSPDPGVPGEGYRVGNCKLLLRI